MISSETNTAFNELPHHAGRYAPSPAAEADGLRRIAAASDEFAQRYSVYISGEAIGVAAAFGRMFGFDAAWVERAIEFLDLACLRRGRNRLAAALPGILQGPARTENKGRLRIVGTADVVAAVADETGLDVAATIQAWADRYMRALRYRLDASERLVSELAHLCVDIKLGARSPFSLGGFYLISGPHEDVLRAAAQAIHHALGNSTEAPVLNLAAPAVYSQTDHAAMPAANLHWLVAASDAEHPHVLLLTQLEKTSSAAAYRLAEQLRVLDTPCAKRSLSSSRNTIVIATFVTDPDSHHADALAARFGDDFLAQLGEPRVICGV